VTALRWPRCGFRFAASRADIRAGRWRRCTEPMLHYWLGGSRKHRGPLIGDPPPGTDDLGAL
jgi:hypothetical protein